MAVESGVNLAKLSDPVGTVDSGRVTTACSIDPQLSKAGVGEAVADGVLGGRELHLDGVAGGLVQGAALTAGGHSAAVCQACSMQLVKSAVTQVCS